MFLYCPQCRRPAPDFPAERKIICPECGFTYYHNVASAVGILLKRDDRFVFLRRAKEPGLGLLDLPGGFVDPDESAEEACRRELREELGVELASLEYAASRPNTYPYKGIVYKTCDLFFRAECVSGPFSLQEDEVSEVLFLSRRDVKMEMFAFGSVRWFLERELLKGES